MSTVRAQAMADRPAQKTKSDLPPGQGGSQVFMQRQGNSTPDLGRHVADTVSSGGSALSPDVRGSMEQRFGRDFSAVRIHDDARAHDSARAANAQAYTVGDHIVFGEGRYQPETSAGQHLLAHELAHTVQQAGLQRRGWTGSRPATIRLSRLRPTVLPERRCLGGRRCR